MAGRVVGHFAGDAVDEFARSTDDIHGAVAVDGYGGAQRLFKNDLVADFFVLFVPLCRIKLVRIAHPVGGSGVHIVVSNVVDDAQVVAVIMTVEAHHDSAGHGLGLLDDLLQFVMRLHGSFQLHGGVAERDAGVGRAENSFAEPLKLFGVHPIAPGGVVKVVAFRVVEIEIGEICKIVFVKHDKAEPVQIKVIITVGHIVCFESFFVAVEVELVVAEDMIALDLEVIVAVKQIFGNRHLMAEIPQFDNKIAVIFFGTRQNSFQTFMCI